MNARHLVPFLLLFAWQAAPTPDPQDRPPTIRAWFGLGSSSYDLGYASDCEGGGFMRKEETEGAGAQLDVWASSRVRLSGALRLGQRGSEAGLLAWEGTWMGLGAGWSGGPVGVGYEGFSGYARLGPIDKWHVRAEVRPPTPMPGVTGWARGGLAYNQGRRNGGSFFMGAAAVRACPHVPCTDISPIDWQPTRVMTDKVGLFVDFTFGFGRTLDAFLRAHLAESARGLGGGLLLRL